MHRKCTVLLLVASLGLGVRVLAAPNPQPTDEARLEVLRLGEITGERLLRETVQKLSREAKREQLRRLIQAGVALAKEKDSPLSYNAAYILLQLCDDVYDADSAEVLYRFLMDKARLLKSENRQAELRLTMFSVLVRTRRFAQAEKIAKEFLETPAERPELERRKPVVLLQLIPVYAYLDRLDEARKILSNLKQIPGLDSHPLILEREAWLLRFTGQYKKAAEIYQKVLKEYEDNGDNTEADWMRYNLGGLYAEMGDVDKATEYFQVLLKKDPENAGYNNDLGYIWVEHDRNLEQAEQMIRKALKKEPDNAAYIDSLAWVYFKKKQFAEAKKLLLQAVALPDGQHPELYDHLGDVHLALGEKEAAIAAWKKALELASPSHRDQQLKRQVEQKIRKAMEK